MYPCFVKCLGRNCAFPFTIDSRYIAVTYNTILHTERNNYNDTTSTRLGIYERHPMSRPHGRAMGCLLWDLSGYMTAIYRQRTVYAVGNKNSVVRRYITVNSVNVSLNLLYTWNNYPHTSIFAPWIVTCTCFWSQWNLRYWQSWVS